VTISFSRITPVMGFLLGIHLLLDVSNKFARDIICYFVNCSLSDIHSITKSSSSEASSRTVRIAWFICYFPRSFLDAISKL
jgi:hypothetical protein